LKRGIVVVPISNIPIKIRRLYLGISVVIVLLCIIVSYNIGILRAAVQVNEDRLRISEAEALIQELKLHRYTLEHRYQGVNTNYIALIKDFDNLNFSHVTYVEENEYLRDELDEQSRRVAELRAVENNLVLQNLELNNQIDTLRLQGQEQEALINSLNSQINVLRTQISELEEENESQASEINDLRRRSRLRR